MRIKVTGCIYLETSFSCIVCGKRFVGDNDEQIRKFQRHLLFRHPFFFLKTYAEYKRAKQARYNDAHLEGYYDENANEPPSSE